MYFKSQSGKGLVSVIELGLEESTLKYTIRSELDNKYVLYISSIHSEINTLKNCKCILTVTLMELNSCKIIVGIVMETQTKNNFDMINK